jgi:hypothetical protein
MGTVLGGAFCVSVRTKLCERCVLTPHFLRRALPQFKDRLSSKTPMGPGFSAKEWEVLQQALERVLVRLCSPTVSLAHIVSHT